MPTATLCDANLWNEFALPAAESTSTTSAKLKLTEGKLGDDGLIDYPGELVVVIPALTATMVPNTKTVTVQVELSNDDFTHTETVTLATLAGSSGVAKTLLRYRVPRTPYQQLRVKVGLGADCTDSSSVKALALWEF